MSSESPASVDFVNELFAAISVKRLPRGSLTQQEMVERRRQQRSLRRQSPTGNLKDRRRRTSAAVARSMLRNEWLQRELSRRELICRLLQGTKQVVDIVYLVELLKQSDLAIEKCRDSFWPYKDKQRLVRIPTWKSLVPDEARSIMRESGVDL